MKENKKDKVIETLNMMLSICEPIKYKEFNKVLKAKNINQLRNYEETNNTVGIAGHGTDNEGISTLSIIATITDILCNKRLSFQIDDNSNIVGVQWYNPAE